MVSTRPSERQLSSERGRPNYPDCGVSVSSLDCLPEPRASPALPRRYSPCGVPSKPRCALYLRDQRSRAIQSTSTRVYLRSSNANCDVLRKR